MGYVYGDAKIHATEHEQIKTFLLEHVTFDNIKNSDESFVMPPAVKTTPSEK